MELDPQELADGRRWFYMAGFAAVLLSFFVVWSDYKLSYSDREQVLGQTLYELRSAQASLGNRSNVDGRLVRGVTTLRGQTVQQQSETAPAKPAETQAQQPATEQ